MIRWWTLYLFYRMNAQVTVIIRKHRKTFVPQRNVLLASVCNGISFSAHMIVSNLREQCTQYKHVERDHFCYYKQRQCMFMKEVFVCCCFHSSFRSITEAISHSLHTDQNRIKLSSFFSLSKNCLFACLYNSEAFFGLKILEKNSIA